MQLLQTSIPQAEYDKVAQPMHDQFMAGYLDPDITHALETTVPPGGLESVGFLRNGGMPKAFMDDQQKGF